jgi:hypothetical protein
VESALKKLGFNPRIHVWNRKNNRKLFGLYLNGKRQTILFYKKINFIGEKKYKLRNFINTLAP